MGIVKTTPLHPNICKSYYMNTFKSLQQVRAELLLRYPQSDWCFKWFSCLIHYALSNSSVTAIPTTTKRPCGKDKIWSQLWTFRCVTPSSVCRTSLGWQEKTGRSTDKIIFIVCMVRFGVWECVGAYEYLDPVRCQASVTIWSNQKTISNAFLAAIQLQTKLFDRQCLLNV